MKFLAFLLLSVVSVAAKDLREIRFPFGDEKELSAFIAETEPQIANDVQRRVWRNALAWMREESDRKNGDFWKWIRGMHAADMAVIGYTYRKIALSEEIEALKKASATAAPEEAARLNARISDLRNTREALHSEVWGALTPPKKDGERFYPEAPR